MSFLELLLKKGRGSYFKIVITQGHNGQYLRQVVQIKMAITLTPVLGVAVTIVSRLFKKPNKVSLAVNFSGS